MKRTQLTSRVSRTLVTLIVLAVSATLTVPTKATTIGLAGSNSGGLLLVVGGVITMADAATVDAALQATRHPHKQVQILMVDSPGGDFDAGLEIADQVHRLGIPVTVRGGCFSACAFIALAASRLTVTRGGLVGVHQAYDLAGTPDLQATRFAAILLRRYGVRRSALAKMLKTPPNELAILSRQELHPDRPK